MVLVCDHCETVGADPFPHLSGTPPLGWITFAVSDGPTSHTLDAIKHVCGFHCLERYAEHRRREESAG